MTPARAGLVVLVAATLLAGCGNDGPDEVTSSAPVEAVSCGAVEQPPLQEGGHLIGDAEPPVAYSSIPPTSGWHASGAPRRGFQPDGLTDPQVVHALEAGDVVAAYDPARLPASQVEQLAAFADGTFRDRLTVTPYPDQPTPLSLLGWGVLQRCDELDEPALAAFVLAHAGATLGH